MTPDLNIHRSAKILIDEHGEDAPLDRASREACAAHRPVGYLCDRTSGLG